MSDITHIPTNIEDDEITLKELIIKIREYVKEILKRWYIPALLSIAIGGYMLYDAMQKKPEYTAKLTFMLNEGDKGMGGMSAILGSFGFGGGGGENNLDKITSIGRSERILKEALLNKANIDGENDFFANHIIKEFDFHKNWEKDTTGLKGFLFKSNELEKFNRTENKALFRVYNSLMGKKPLYSCGYDKKSGILTMSTKTPNEDLSIGFTNTAYAILSKFYIEKITERERENYDVIKGQRDSIYRVMVSKGVSAASFGDRNRGLLFNSDRFQGEKLRTEATVAATAYGRSLEGFAMADYALRNNMPFISPIDTPVGPIEPERNSKKMALIMGVFLGSFLGAIYIIGAKILREAMAS